MNHAKNKIELTRDKITSYTKEVMRKSKKIDEKMNQLFKTQETVLNLKIALMGSDFDIVPQLRMNLEDSISRQRNLQIEIDGLRKEHNFLANELEIQKDLLRIRIEDYRKTK